MPWSEVGSAGVSTMRFCDCTWAGQQAGEGRAPANQVLLSPHWLYQGGHNWMGDFRIKLSQVRNANLHLGDKI